MEIEILSTGNEICLGNVLDTNSAYIAQKLLEIGQPVKRHNCVGDNIEELVSILKEISFRSDIAIVTGGLGPTTDDLTTEAAAKAASVEIIKNDEALLSVESYFESKKRFMTKLDEKQALIPESAVCINNPIGSAPGFGLKIGKCLFFFLPGVPSEMEKMFSDSVLNIIVKLAGNQQKLFKVKTIKTFGLSEAAINERLFDIKKMFPDIILGLRANFPEIEIKLYITGTKEIDMENNLYKAIKYVQDKIDKYIFSLDEKNMEEVVGFLLRKNSATVALAESCTGGLVSDLITNICGSSDYLIFSGVFYSNESKIKILGVSQQTIEKFGAVHEETAKEMAKCIRNISGATYGISLTGIAGPGGGTIEKPAGTVCIGLASPDSILGYRFYFPFNDRLKHKKIFAITSLNILRLKMLETFL